MSEYRYLIDFDSETLEKEYHDVVIIGSGIAGVYTALEIPPEIEVAILTKETLNISNSVLAQGGIAVSLDKKDSPELHFRDTIFAGAGLCDEESVWVLVNEAAQNIGELCKFGVNFDKTGRKELALTREAAHSMNRIIHAGDTTGKEVCDKLISVAKTRENIKIFEKTFVLDIVTKDGVCKGVLVCDENGNSLKLLVSDVVICATGGFGRLYSGTTNPEVATGDGVSMAYRAGAELMDLEFVQFHPTVLYHPQNKSFLISEAVRGEGALLRNADGKRFMPDYHPLCELAPRDVVSRAIFEEMKKTGSPNVYLDITFKDKAYLETRFPNIFKTCLGYGIDISKDMIPVAPAEHYCMGGIKSDVKGRTNIERLFTCGECACTGIHGANRLASNSILEGLVFGRLIGDQVKALVKTGAKSKEPLNITYKTSRKAGSFDRRAVKTDIQETMTTEVGIIRDGEGLRRALNKINAYKDALADARNEGPEDCELQNILLLSKLVVESALKRTESRGAHFRSDFAKTDDANWKKHIIKVS